MVGFGKPGAKIQFITEKTTRGYLPLNMALVDKKHLRIKITGKQDGFYNKFVFHKFSPNSAL